jgi:hypothetical protein
MDYKSLFAINELTKIDNIEYIVENLNLINKSSIQLIESLYIEKPKLKVGEVFIETLTLKISLITISILELTKGFKLETNSKFGTKKLIDFSSINILARSIIEAFLTLEYLFYNNLNPEEKEFRFTIWQISGYKSRQSFFDEKNREQINKDISEKLENENKEINSLLTQVRKSKFYSEVKENDLWKLDKYGLPRLKSWQKLLESSILKNEIFITFYKLYSNYAHSEFISLIQTNGKDTLNQGSSENLMQIRNALRIILYINCVSIIQLVKKFPLILPEYKKLTKNQKELIEFWFEFATDIQI